MPTDIVMTDDQFREWIALHIDKVAAEIGVQLTKEQRQRYTEVIYQQCRDMQYNGPTIH